MLIFSRSLANCRETSVVHCVRFTKNIQALKGAITVRILRSTEKLFEESKAMPGLENRAIYSLQFIKLIC